MDRILELDVADQVAVVAAGRGQRPALRAVATRACSTRPTRRRGRSPTIGGNVATNAGGLCCVKYGVTADFVRGLEVVLGTGEVLRTGRRTVKGVAGYDLTHLLVGSEGTLGVVTEVTLGLRPAPEPALTAAATFLDGHDALRAAAAVMSSGLRPSLLEFIDGITTRAIQSYRDMGLPEDVGGILLAQSDRGERAAEDVQRIASICTQHGAVEVAEAGDADEADLLLEARRLVNAGLEPLGSKPATTSPFRGPGCPTCCAASRRSPENAGRHRLSRPRRGRQHAPRPSSSSATTPTPWRPERRSTRSWLGLALGGTTTGEHRRRAAQAALAGAGDRSRRSRGAPASARCSTRAAS